MTAGDPQTGCIVVVVLEVSCRNKVGVELILSNWLILLNIGLVGGVGVLSSSCRCKADVRELSSRCGCKVGVRVLSRGCSWELRI